MFWVEPEMMIAGVLGKRKMENGNGGFDKADWYNGRRSEGLV